LKGHSPPFDLGIQGLAWKSASKSPEKLRARAHFVLQKLAVKGGEKSTVDFESPNFVQPTIRGKHTQSQFQD